MFSPIIPRRLATDLATVRFGPDAVKSRFLAFAHAQLQGIDPLQRYSKAAFSARPWHPGLGSMDAFRDAQGGT